MSKKIKKFFSDDKKISKLIFSVLVLGLVFGIIGQGVLAYFQRTTAPTTGWQYGYGYGGELGYDYGYGYGSDDDSYLWGYGYLMGYQYPSSATSSLSATGITITVATDYLSLARVTYGTSAGSYTVVPDYTTEYSASAAISLSGLTPNTVYYYKSQSKDIAGNEYLEQTEKDFTTLANIPTSLSGTANSRTQITASWNANSNPSGTQYYAENTTAGTNSGWITNASWASSGLSCGTSYSFKVKARNSENAQTAFTSAISVSTQACARSGGGGGSGVSVPFVPSPVSPEKPIAEMTIEELKAEIDRIIALIAQFRVELMKLAGYDCVIASFDRNLQLGMAGNDVKCLQVILNSDSETRLAATGVGSSGNETNYFGLLTRTAAIKFQEKYASEILTPLNLTAGTGFVGSSTRIKLNQLLGK